MKLAWCRYDKDTASKYMLLLILGCANDKVIAFDAADMDKSDIGWIRKNRADLAGESAADATRKIMKHCNCAQRYRTLHEQKLVILKTYDIK